MRSRAPDLAAKPASRLVRRLGAGRLVSAPLTCPSPRLLAHRPKPESFFPYSICTPNTGPEHHRRAAYGSDISATARNLSLARVLASDAPPPPLARSATPRTNCSSSTSAPTPARSTSAPWTTWDRGSEQTQPFPSRPPAPASPLSWRPFPPTPSAAPPRSPSVAPAAVPPPLAALRPPGLSSAPTAPPLLPASAHPAPTAAASPPASRSRLAFALWISFTRSSRPAFSAIVVGVRPLKSSCCGLAPCLRRVLVLSAEPFSTARCNGVRPFQSCASQVRPGLDQTVYGFGMARLRRSMQGCGTSVIVVIDNRPAWIRRSTMSLRPASAARCRGAAPV